MFFGGAVFYHNPKAYYNGQWYALQPLATEGIQYNRLNVSLPVGGGLSLSIGRHHNFGWELGWRQSFTDYLDDVSGHYADAEAMVAAGNIIGAALSNRSGEFLGADHPDIPTANELRGDTKLHDMYFVFGLTVSYHFLDNGLMRGRTRNRNKIGCQRF